MKDSQAGKRARGRPPKFNREAALAKATRLFWQHGYEGTSLADLSVALEATPPTLYAAFGPKDRLYQAALQYYVEHEGAHHLAAFSQGGSALASLTRFLQQIARGFTAPDQPPGCMVSIGTLQCAASNMAIAKTTTRMRKATAAMFRQRFEQARDDGELPAGSDVDALARFYTAVTQGMAVQAHDGATEEQLRTIAEMALAAWPGSRLPHTADT